MNAVEVVRMARTAGIELTIAGGNLKLSAAAEPPVSVIEALRHHKLQIVKLLLSGQDRSEAVSSRPYDEVIAKLRSSCPDHVDPERWRHAVQDADRFVAGWGKQARAVGWTDHELFGLHNVPERPAATYRRLSRYDQTGLIWLLHGRPVIALTDTTATIQGAAAIVTYRKLNKPALGPVGDSLDEFR
jgi:hypothetical protein